MGSRAHGNAREEETSRGQSGAVLNSEYLLPRVLLKGEGSGDKSLRHGDDRTVDVRVGDKRRERERKISACHRGRSGFGQFRGVLGPWAVGLPLHRYAQHLHMGGVKYSVWHVPYT